MTTKSPKTDLSDAEKSSSPAHMAQNVANSDERAHNTVSSENAIRLPNSVAGSGALDKLVDKARDYASKSTADNTNLAYKKDWDHFASWCRRKGADPLACDPQVIGLYITDLAAPSDGTLIPSPPLAVSTIERRLSGLAWNFRQRGQHLDRQDRHIATVLAGIRREHAKPPVQKEALFAGDIIQMISILQFDLRGIRDKAILLIGYAGGLRRSEIVGLDVGKDETEDSGGWIDILDDGAVIWIKGKTGWRDVEIGKGSSDATCPIHALQQWLYYSKIVHGPIFRAVTHNHSSVKADRLNDKHISRLIKKCVAETGIGPEKGEKDRILCFSGHSLRAGLASSAEADERYVQRQLGHTSAEMTRRYQRRRDRFRINLTKSVGL